METAARVPLHRALPPNRRRQIALAFPLKWNVKRAYRLPIAGEIGPYYIGWDAGTGTYGEDWTIAPRDESGVILTGGADRAYHPIRIAQYALHLHDRHWMDGSEKVLGEFMVHARWLRDNQTERGGIPGCYVFSFAWEKYGAAPGWISAMAQGEAVSVLIRAHALAHGQGFGDAALAAAEPFKRTLDEGGVVWRGNDGDVFLEEAATAPAAHILNGCLFALFGVYDLMHLTGEPWVGQLFEDVVVTLLRRLQLFDAGYWSYYSLLESPDGHRTVATLKYHAFHVAQLRVLAAMTGDAYFYHTSGDWDAYRTQLAARLKVVGNELAGLHSRFVTKRDTVPGGARAII